MNRCLIFGGTAGVVALASAVTSNLCPWGMQSQIFFALPFALAFATILCDASLPPASLIARSRTAVLVAAPTVLIGRLLTNSVHEAFMPVGTAVVVATVTLSVAGATAWDGPFARSRFLKLASISTTFLGLSILPSVVLALFAWITTGGTLSIPDHLVMFLNWPLGAALLELRPFLSSWMLPGAGLIALAFGRRFGVRAGLVASDILIGLGILGWGYRFTGLVAIGGLVLLDAFGTLSPLNIRKRALAWLALLVLCTLPFDVSLYDSVPPPKWTPAASGLWTGSQYEYMERGETYVVGSCVPFYLEPRWMWTW
jgi:hypothetical protein